MSFSVLTLHALAGVVVFVLGLVQFGLKKGGSRHRRLGQVYLAAWVVLVATGAAIGSLMVTFLGLFGLYFVATGARFGRRRANLAGPLDAVLVLAGLGVSLAILASSARLFMQGDGTFGTVFAVFGLLFLTAAWQDVRQYVLGRAVKPLTTHTLNWYLEHIGRMSISFIAATTAFSVIQDVFRITLLNWLLPTVVGTVLLTWYKRREMRRRKITPTPPVAARPTA